MTYFSTLYPPTRTLLGDTATIPGYSSDQLDLGISLALLQETAFAEGAQDATGRTITPDLAVNNDKIRIAVRSAIALVQPQAGAFSYKTKVLSIQRDNGVNGQLGYLQGLLRDIIDGGFVVASETEWDQFVRGPWAAITKIRQFPQLPTLL